jgi:[acyl-carrier-protein] S-malonyltransferase
MTPVQSALINVMQHLTWHDAQIPLVANVSGVTLTAREHIRQELTAQITSPVQWVRCVETLIAEGCDTFIELGSSQVLTRLVRSIAPGSKCYAADTPEKVAALAKTLNTYTEPVYA